MPAGYPEAELINDRARSLAAARIRISAHDLRAIIPERTLLYLARSQREVSRIDTGDASILARSILAQ